MRVITYSRISKQDDRDIIPGIQCQRDDCLAFAQEHGHEVVDEISDNLCQIRVRPTTPLGTDRRTARTRMGTGTGGRGATTRAS